MPTNQLSIMKLGSIQLLRAFAVILIVYMYAIDLAPDYAQSKQYNFYYLKTWGAIGIDLFCVISGFVVYLTARTLKGPEEGWRFLKARFRRINPMFYGASILFFASQYLLLWSVNSPNMFLLNSRLASGLVDTVWIMPTSRSLMEYKLYLPIGWSLAFAWLFSLLFYCTIVMKVNRKILTLSSFIFLLVIAGYLFNPRDFRLQFVTNAMTLEFIIGCIICQIYLGRARVSPVVSRLLVAVGLGTMLLPVFVDYGRVIEGIGPDSRALSLQRLLMLGLPAGFLLAGCVFLEKSGSVTRMWNNRLFQSIGDASYSIFLSHAILFTLLSIVYYKSKYLLLTDLAIPLQVVLAICLGIIIHRGIEKPLLKWITRPKFSKSKTLMVQELPQT